MLYSLYCAHSRGRSMHAGFTLIELLVVVLIIGILAAVALPQYTQSVEKARAAEALLTVRAISDANRRYFMANGVYEADLNNLDIQIPGADGMLGVPRKESKFFSYAASIATDGKNTLAVANRFPVSSRYAFVAYEGATSLQCKFYSPEGEKVCKTFGPKLSDNHYVVN